MTAWHIFAGGFVFVMALAVLLQNRVEMARARAAIKPDGDEYERGMRDGLEAAARICAATGGDYGEAYARQIRAMRRGA